MTTKSLIVEGIGKLYRIAKANPTPDATLSRADRLRKFFSIPLTRQTEGRELWALRDVTFDVDAGSVVGVIGSNGAGKTTLLKILAKVISPTTGRVRGRGRVVSLLELGAGFDDESTARENIFMNAALNGIPKHVVQRRFDDIIGFAELQEFVDQPLLYYSSGMYLRLAFSVAINMEPSILLADEILAVGDAVFQERCLQKVRELSEQSGLTVLFVSHDMEAIARICDRVIWVKDGALHRDGQPDEVVTEYQNAAWAMLTSAPAADFHGSSHASKYGEIVEVKLISADGREIGSPPRNEDVYIRLRFRTHRSKTRARCTIELHSKGVLVLRSTQPFLHDVGADQAYEAHVKIPANLLADTGYTVNAGLTLIRGEGEEHSLVKDKALSFMVYDEEHVDAPAAALQRKGVINPALSWTIEVEPNVIRA